MSIVDKIKPARIIPARAGFTPRRERRPRWGADHPRSRGVYGTTRAPTRACPGSSPLARGLPGGAAGGGLGAGIIPARAGFTPWGYLRTGRTRDHPRSRGVYGTGSAPIPARAGSSPLARGLHVTTDYRKGLIRIIPARAGFTPPPAGRPPPSAWIIPARAGFTPVGGVAHRGARDHPRSRGVYAAALSSESNGSGSSPLARGLHGNMTRMRAVTGIIPARAGFTRQEPARHHRARDHPRSRGVYGTLSGTDSGTPWIIPARAGFTIPPIRKEPLQWDHPRSRGVYAIRRGGRSAVRGSSPLARGLPGDLGGDGDEAGIIPARAGFTFAGNRPAGRSRGSSPLARGLPVAGEHEQVAVRIIPARAGFTGRHPRRRLGRPGSSPLARGLPTCTPSCTRGGPGSSPLARGLLLTLPDGGTKVGIIPARAGFTQPITEPVRDGRDHPRSRGVYCVDCVDAIRSAGSSPLARGLLPPRGTKRGQPWIIPARAGFTRR